MIIESSEDLEVVKSFDELGLRDELVRGKRSHFQIITYISYIITLFIGIYAYGFNKPSAVQ